jgi:hypothetical protein
MTSLVPLFQVILATNIEEAKKEILQIHMISRERKNIYILMDGMVLGHPQSSIP